MSVRIATDRDLDGIVETLTVAFESDPVWSWAFPERSGLEAWWRLYAGSALRYPWTWIADEFAAVAVWIPPGGVELTEDEEATITPLLSGLLGGRAAEVSRLVERFGTNHPTDQPHYFLSLLGTHPAHRGQGLGMALLADNLAMIDLEHAPAYLESTNPGNDARYERQGFHRVGEFSRPDGQAVVSTMWRAAR